MTWPAGAVILAGGRGQRLGGRDKPGLRLGAKSLLQIALDAAGDCRIVVVGRPRELPAGVVGVQEDPPGGGPAAGLAAGMAALAPLSSGAMVAVLAADLPGVSRATIDRLAAALTAGTADDPDASRLDGAVLIDSAGRRQYLTGVWRSDALSAAIDRRADWQGAPLRELLGPLHVLQIPGLDRETEDVDTPDDWRRWQS